MCHLCDKNHTNGTYDFSKLAENNDIPKINHLWYSIPSQLANINS